MVHVHATPGGPTVLTPLPFADLALEARGFAQAARALRPILQDRLQSLEPIDRAALAEAADATLLRVPVEVPIDGDAANAVQLTVGLVAVQKTIGSRRVAVGYVPVIADFELVQADGDLEKLVERAIPKIAGRLRSWTAANVLNADEPDDTELAFVEVDVQDDALIQKRPLAATATNTILEERGTDLTKRTLGRFDGREELVSRVSALLADPGRSSVLLVGPPDVGKSALLYEIARRLHADDLTRRPMWRLSANELIAGSQYTGQWQEAVRRLIADARKTNAIVVMGDPVGIVDAGRWSQSSNNASRFLRPYIESGDLTIVCEGTAEQLGAAEKKEPGFIGSFHRVDVPEPTLKETMAIVATTAARSSAEFTEGALEAAVELTRRFEPYRGFPGKAVRLVEDTVRHAEGATIDREAVTREFATRTGLPLTLVSDDVPLRTAEVKEAFEAAVLGQPEATAAVTDVVAVLKAGLNDPNRPLASLFFVGPTGVGKTELAKALAEFLFGSRERLLRFDMGEYASADAAQRLIGTAWGADEGVLVREVRQQPFAVVLLDEIEKAHWSVFDALLAAIGEGRLTDAAGRTADFRNAIVIMTSNLGARTARTGGLGFTPAVGSEHQSYIEAAERFFRPEFFNRIDRILVFHSLTAEIVRRIARREIQRLLEREGIIRRQLRIEVDDAAVDAVAAKGFHARYGARPLQREVAQAIIQPLARLLVDRAPSEQEFVRVYVDGGHIAVAIERPEEPEARVSRSERRVQRDEGAFARAEASVNAFVDRLNEDEASARASDIREALTPLVEETHAQTFWETPDRARETLQGIYRLESAVGRWDALRNRAAGLVEMARRVREARDQSRVREVEDAVSEMDDQLTVLRLELTAAAAGARGGAATIRVVPVGQAAEQWAAQLIAMYAAWAERTGREATPTENELGIVIDGLATYDLLAGERGLHRHVKPDGTDELARVVVQLPDDPELEPDGGVVARVYEEGKRRLVRDPRTSAKETHVNAVLEGRIDAFLIAALREL